MIYQKCFSPFISMLEGSKNQLGFFFFCSAEKKSGLKGLIYSNIWDIKMLNVLNACIYVAPGPVRHVSFHCAYPHVAERQ